MRPSDWLKTAVILASGLGVFGCGSNPPQLPSPEATPKSAVEGTLVFHLSDTIKVRIPTNRSPEKLVLKNGAERLVLLPIDSACYRVPVFDGMLCLDREGQGSWTDVLRTGRTPYTVDIEFIEEKVGGSINGEWTSNETWRMAFGNEDPWFGDLVLNRSSKGQLKGTIETATGDFRYLHGEETNGMLTLQTFDGAHLFHFSANTSITDSLVDGVFSSGNHYQTPFTAHLKSDSDAPLASGNQAVWTQVPIGYAGKDLLGNPTEWVWSASDSAVHVLSVMGSWCPNCMDEHRLLADLMKSNPQMHVHTLAFERGLDRVNGEKMALNRLKQYSESMELWRYPNRWHVNLIGPASKTEAQKRLPFLDKVVSFPTSIVLVPGANQPWIHSGFNGPATGEKHELERNRFTQVINGLQESR
jgi:thiol-disulfide isomerase/thioredoxin